VHSVIAVQPLTPVCFYNLQVLL